MSKLLIITLIAIILFSPLVSAYILSPTKNLKGEIDPDTKAFYIGHTALKGNFRGSSVPLKRHFKSIDLLSLLYNFSMDDFTFFPLVGSSSFHVDNVLIIDLENLSNLSFSNVDIFPRNALFLLGLNKGSIKVDSEASFAVSTFLPYSYHGYEIPLLCVVTTFGVEFLYRGEHPILAQLSGEGQVAIRSNNKILWNEKSSGKLFLIQDTHFSITQEPPLYLFPLDELGAELSIKKADPRSINIDRLLEYLLKYRHFISFPISTSMLQLTSIVNGGMVLVGNDTVEIDGSTQKFSTFGLVRGKEFSVNVSSKGSAVSGECQLIFLGDRFYTRAETCLIIPIIWVLGICLYILRRPKDSKSRYASIFHLVALIISVILVDREISYQFGTSALDMIFYQEISPFLALFAGIEFFIWIIGFLVLAIPVRMIVASLTKSKGLAKGIGNLSIWFFCAFYAQLILNLLFLVVNPTDLMR
jgi:hypothetical protein